MTWKVSRLWRGCPKGLNLRALPVTPVWSLGGGEGHWLPSQRLTHLMDSVLQCSRQLGEAQGLQGGLPAFGVYGAEGWVSLGSVCSQALPLS